MITVYSSFWLWLEWNWETWKFYSRQMRAEQLSNLSMLYGLQWWRLQRHDASICRCSSSASSFSLLNSSCINLLEDKTLPNFKFIHCLIVSVRLTLQTWTCCFLRGKPPCVSCGWSCGRRSPWQQSWPLSEPGKPTRPPSFFTGLPAKTDTRAASPPQRAPCSAARNIHTQSRRFESSIPLWTAAASSSRLLDGRGTSQQGKDMRKPADCLLFLTLPAWTPGLWFYLWLKSIWIFSSRR